MYVIRERERERERPNRAAGPSPVGYTLHRPSCCSLAETLADGSSINPAAKFLGSVAVSAIIKCRPPGSVWISTGTVVMAAAVTDDVHRGVDHRVGGPDLLKICKRGQRMF